MATPSITRNGAPIRTVASAGVEDGPLSGAKSSAPETKNVVRRSLGDSHARLQGALEVVDLVHKRAELGDLQQQSEASDLWNDPAKARDVVQVRAA